MSLPERLEQLVADAHARRLKPLGSALLTHADINDYVLSWASSYARGRDPVHTLMRLWRVEELRSGVPAPEQPRPAPKPRRSPPVPAQPSAEHDLLAKESPRVKTDKPKVRKKHTQQGAPRF